MIIFTSITSINSGLVKVKEEEEEEIYGYNTMDHTNYRNMYDKNKQSMQWSVKSQCKYKTKDNQQKFYTVSVKPL